MDYVLGAGGGVYFEREISPHIKLLLDPPFDEDDFKRAEEWNKEYPKEAELLDQPQLPYIDSIPNNIPRDPSTFIEWEKPETPGGLPQMPESVLQFEVEIKE